ncbi:hypothetical protein ACFQO4_04755 [Saliphagus sp. GCM10025334]
MADLLAPIKLIVKPIMRLSPRAESDIRKVYRQIRLYKFKTAARFNSLDESIDPLKIVEVDPARIEHMGFPKGNPFDPWSDDGKVVGGDWDTYRRPFKQTDVYQSFEQRYVDGYDWEETPWFQRVVKEIESGNPNRGCETREEWIARCKQIDDLFNRIRDEGFKSQQNLIANNHTHPLDMNVSESQRQYDEITVNVGHDGRLLFNNGRHRLSIAKILSLDSVPVRILVRHNQWVRFRNELLEYLKREMNGKSYNELLHPDLHDIPHSHDSGARFEMIQNNLKSDDGTMLDIGANVGGYFAHRFEDLGFDCIAVEHIPTRAYFLRNIRNANGYEFEVAEESIFDYEVGRDFTVVLALNIFHHFLKTEDTYNELLDLLANLKMDELVFQSHARGSPQMESAYKQLAEDEFAEFLIEYSCLSEFERIGTPEDDSRPLYILR